MAYPSKHAHTESIEGPRIYEPNDSAIAVEEIVHEEALCLICDEREQKKLLQIGISVPNNPSVSITLDIPEDYFRQSYTLEICEYGFVVKSQDKEETLAYNTYNKNLAKDFNDIDIEFIRGLAALALIQLEYRISHKAYIYDVIFSPQFTEFLHKCKEWLSSKKHK